MTTLPTSYDAAMPQRNHLLVLLDIVVVTYLTACVYIIALYGTLVPLPLS